VSAVGRSIGGAATLAEPRAVVVGGGMAGLLAAHALAAHVDAVTLVERDRLPDGPVIRPGVPQAHHVHVLLTLGRVLLEERFPGFGDELAAAGAMRVEWPADLLWLSPVGWAARPRVGIWTYACSRELLEWLVRRRVLASGKVQVLAGYDAVGLTATADGRAVTGVRLRARDGGRPTELRAGLVVDASGRGSRAPEWLQALGYAPPAETTVDSFLGYASRVYAAPDDDLGWKVLIVQSRPPDLPRTGIISPVEGGRWMVTLSGAARDYPPIDEAGFLAFARQMAGPVLHEAIENVRPLSPIHGYRGTQNRIRHYERLAALPERFLVLGDAACAFNPIYGQGMTVGLQAAAVLDRCLAVQGLAHPAGLAKRFQHELATANSAAWLMATGADYQYPTTVGGRRSPVVRMAHRYLDRMLRVGTRDAVVMRRFLEAAHLLCPPARLFAPTIAARVLLPRRARRRAG